MNSTKVLQDVLREWSQIFMSRSGHDFKSFMHQTGLSFSQVNVLMYLYHGGKGGISDLGERMGISNAASSQVIDRMVNQGLIYRLEDPNDRRAKQLTITSEGRLLIEKGFEARQKWLSGLVDSLSPEQRDQVITALTLLIQLAQKTGD